MFRHMSSTVFETVFMRTQRDIGSQAGMNRFEAASFGACARSPAQARFVLSRSVAQVSVVHGLVIYAAKTRARKADASKLRTVCSANNTPQNLTSVFR